MTIKLEDLDARAMFYEFTADEDQEGAFWSLLSESDRAGWRRVADFVDRVVAFEKANVRAEQTVADLLALLAVYEEKPIAYQWIRPSVIRSIIESGGAL